jgi:transposase InsO family protein
MEGTQSIPTRYRLRVKQRLAVVEYVNQHGIKPASRQFGLARPTVRQWWRNWQRAGIQGLVPRYPARRRRRISTDVVALITQARREHEFGASRTRIWLERVHHVRVATETIQRVFRDIGVPHLVKTRRRRPKQLKLFEKERPGDSVQVDVKVVARGRKKWFQYTAIDDCTRVRVLRLYRRQNHRSSLAFLRELTAAFPFQIRKIQVDNGTEFPLLFALTCQELGVRVRYIRPRRPQQNGKVERSHRIDEEEFWARYEGQDFDAAGDALAAWERRYNHERFSMALHGRTPMEKLTAMLAPPVVMARAPDNLQ